MASTRTSFTLDTSLAEKARMLGINISAAARDGVAAAVRDTLTASDRAAYLQTPEQADQFWADGEAWSGE